MNNVSKFDKCANCGACYNICPTTAITVKNEHFYTIDVDETKCVDCGQCVTVCPVNSFQKVQNIIAGYSVEHNSKTVVLESSSGGAFSAFAEYILMQGGVVWGAGYSESFDKVIFQSTREVSIDCLKRSKYVESMVGDSFTRIKKMLDEGILVLFCGAPCQVAGLKRFLGEYDNLYTMDFSCGGVASHKLYQEWLNLLEKKYKSLVSGINFRSKYFGWGIYCVSVKFQNGKNYIKPAILDPYFASFINGKLSVREYCYQCQFSDNHYADLILADYWKYKDTFPEDNYSGLSLVLVNSSKGASLFRQVESSISCYQLPLNKATYNIKETQMNSNRYRRRTAFLEKTEQEGLVCAAETYVMPGLLKKIIYLVRVYTKRIIQRRLK